MLVPKVIPEIYCLLRLDSIEVTGTRYVLPLSRNSHTHEELLEMQSLAPNRYKPNLDALDAKMIAAMREDGDWVDDVDALQEGETLPDIDLTNMFNDCLDIEVVDEQEDSESQTTSLASSSFSRGQDIMVEFIPGEVPSSRLYSAPKRFPRPQNYTYHKGEKVLGCHRVSCDAKVAYYYFQDDFDDGIINWKRRRPVNVDGRGTCELRETDLFDPIPVSKVRSLKSMLGMNLDRLQSNILDQFDSANWGLKECPALHIEIGCLFAFALQEDNILHCIPTIWCDTDLPMEEYLLSDSRTLTELVRVLADPKMFQDPSVGEAQKLEYSRLVSKFIRDLVQRIQMQED